MRRIDPDLRQAIMSILKDLDGFHDIKGRTGNVPCRVCDNIDRLMVLLAADQQPSVVIEQRTTA